MEKLRFFDNVNNGMLITFCGLDGCGKTTMIEKLYEQLTADGYDVVVTKQPTNAVRKLKIFRTYMDSPDHSDYDYMNLSLIAAGDRIQHSNKFIVPLLQEGKIVISDRYFYSCIANLHARGYRNAKWIYEISENIVRPDISFFLDVSVKTALNRVRARPEEKNKFIDVRLQHELHREYLEIASLNDGYIIKNETDKEGSFKKITEVVYGYLNKCKKNSFGFVNEQITQRHIS